MIVTIDLNVILDVYLLRSDYVAAMEVFTICKEKKVIGNTPSHAVPTIYYVLRKKIGRSKARELCGELLHVLDIVPIGKAQLLEAQQSLLDDFEDAIVEVAAIQTKSSFIITSNLKDFQSSRLPALTPAQFLRTL
jgi:hypothetical protein